MSVKKRKTRKGRESKNLPPEKLHEILCGIYPEKIADELFLNLIERETNEKGGGADA